jgi:hypothetical protein
VFKDNAGAIELAKAPRMRPWTKHIDIQYHHFQEAVQQKKINISHVSTHEQLANIVTKPLPKSQFQYLRKLLCRWWTPLVCEGVLGSLRVPFRESCNPRANIRFLPGEHSHQPRHSLSLVFILLFKQLNPPHIMRSKGPHDQMIEVKRRR